MIVNTLYMDYSMPVRGRGDSAFAWAKSRAACSPRSPGARGGANAQLPLFADGGDLNGAVKFSAWNNTFTKAGILWKHFIARVHTRASDTEQATIACAIRRYKRALLRKLKLPRQPQAARASLRSANSGHEPARCGCDSNRHERPISGSTQLLIAFLTHLWPMVICNGRPVELALGDGNSGQAQCWPSRPDNWPVLG